MRRDASGDCSAGIVRAVTGFRATGPARRPRARSYRATSAAACSSTPRPPAAPSRVDEDLLPHAATGHSRHGHAVVPQAARGPTRRAAGIRQVSGASAARRSCTCIESVVDDDASLPLDMQRGRRQGIVAGGRVVGARPGRWRSFRRAPPADTPEKLAASIARGRKLVSRRGAVREVSWTAGRRPRRAAGAVRRLEQAEARRARPSRPGELAGRFRLPIERLHPRDFTRGSLSRRRSADRPVLADLRGDQGDADAGRTARRRAAGACSTPEEIWDVVNYVRSLGQRDKKRDKR